MRRVFCFTLAFVGLAVLLSVHYSLPMLAKSNQSQQCSGCGDQGTSNEHVLFGSYYNIRDYSASLILNNKGPNPLSVRPTIFSLEGDRLELGPIELRDMSATTLDLRLLLTSAGDKFREGSLELRYIYEGCNLVLSSGIILEDAKDRIAFDELLARRVDFASNRLAGVWWLPSARSNMFLVLANHSAGPLLTSVEVRSLGRRGDVRTLDVMLRPHETKKVNVPKDLTIQGHGMQQWAAGSVTLRHSGGPGDLVARGMIEDRLTHYSSVIEFADPAAIIGTEWHATGLRLGSTNGQPLYPMVVVYNAGDLESNINLRIPYTNADKTTQILALDPIALAPGEVRELSPEVQRLTASLDYDLLTSAGMEIAYSTASGTVMALAQSVSRDGNYVFRVPMVDPRTKGSAGNYPWRVDDATSTFVYLKNDSLQPQDYTVQVDFEGGSYVLGLEKLSPHETLKLDLRALRDSQKPDQHGVVMPLEASEGQVNWSVIGPDNHAMIGRSEYVSETYGLASTFACSNCCGDSYYTGYIVPNSGTFSYDDTLEYAAFQQNRNCYGGLLNAYRVYSDAWESTNVYVATINTTGIAAGVATGVAAIINCWTVYVHYWGGWDMGCLTSSHVECKSGGARVIRVSISPVSRATGLPYSVSPGQTKSVPVTIEPASDPPTIDFDIVNCSSDNGTAYISGSTSLTGSGNITIVGDAQTAVSNQGNLKIRAKYNSTELVRSSGFTVCAHLSAINRIDAVPSVGSLKVNYSFSSDSGSSADLDQVQCQEILVPPGTDDPYWAPNPPFFLWTYPNPDIHAPFNIGAGTLSDNHLKKGTLNKNGPTAEFNLAQAYKWRCLRCGSTWNSAAGFIINRSVFGSSPFYYQVKKGIDQSIAEEIK